MPNKLDEIEKIIDSFIEYGGEEQPNFNRITNVKDLAETIATLIASERKDAVEGFVKKLGEKEPVWRTE